MSYKGSQWKTKKEWKRVSIKIEKPIYQKFLQIIGEKSVNAAIIELIENRIVKFLNPDGDR